MAKRMVEIARKLRQRQTRPEDLLWRILRNRRELGLKFRRQVPIGHYVVDFACLEKRLVVEIDGPVHLDPLRREADRLRQDWLTSEGLLVIRLTADEVAGDPELATARIRALLAAT